MRKQEITRLEKKEIDKEVRKKKKSFYKYQFKLDDLIELHALQDLARKSRNDLDLFDYTLSILNQRMPSIEADAYILSDVTNTFYRYETTDTEVFNDPYSFLTKETTDRLLKGKFVRIDDNKVILPLIGQPYIKEKISYPENDKIVVGAILVKSPETIPKKLYYQKFANRLGSAYHHYAHTQHSVNLADQIELTHGTLDHDLRGPLASMGMSLVLQEKKYKRIEAELKQLKDIELEKLKEMVKEDVNKEDILKQIDLLSKDTIEGKIGKIFSEMRKDNMTTIRKQQTIENNLSDYLLSIQLIGKHKVKLNYQDFNIYERIFKEVYSEFEEKAKQRNMYLDMTLKGIPQDIEVCGDPIRLKSVVRNLVSNAIKYGERSGKVALGYESDNKEHRFIVWNSGPEIPKDERHKLFKKWQRLETEETRKVEGTGFGLYSAKYIVEAHEGRIWYDYGGYEEKGSTFIFSIPKKEICSPNTN